MEVSKLSQNTTAAPSMCTMPIDWLANRKDFLECYSFRECSLIPTPNLLNQPQNIGIGYCKCISVTQNIIQYQLLLNSLSVHPSMSRGGHQCINIARQ